MDTKTLYLKTSRANYALRYLFLCFLSYLLLSCNSVSKADLTNTMSSHPAVGSFQLFIGIAIAIILLISAMLVFCVISKRKLTKFRIEAERLRKSAEDAQERQNYFMHNMNHEIRTPINAIIGFSQLLIEENEFTEIERRQFGETIKNNGKILIQIIDDVLDMARIESGKYKLSYEPIKINYLCRQSIETLTQHLPDGVHFVFESDVSDDFIYFIDSRRLNQILLNFLSNACKHVRGDFISLSVKHVGDKLKFLVKNPGSVIPVNKRKCLFQRFGKLNNYAQGTGLGLNICFMLAELMGGRVYYDDSYTDGACFVCELPFDNSNLYA